MAIRLIVKHPDSVLREVSKPIKKINSNVLRLLEDMADTMYDANGVGLAAPQVGILKRLIVIDTGDEHGLIQLINPEIIERKGEQTGSEGCLSIPTLRGEVKRAMEVRVRSLSVTGEEIELVGTGLLARAIQHEIDHLDGVLFIDIADTIHESKEE